MGYCCFHETLTRKIDINNCFTLSSPLLNGDTFDKSNVDSATKRKIGMKIRYRPIFDKLIQRKQMKQKELSIQQE